MNSSIVAALQKPVPLPPGHIHQVIVANSPVTEPVKTVLSSLNLPKGIRNQIDAAQTGISERKQLEIAIQQTEIEMQQLKNEFIRLCLDSHLVLSIDTVLDNSRSADKRTQLALAATTDTQKATQLIADLRTDASVLQTTDSQRATDINRLCDFFECVKNRVALTGGFDSLTTTDEQLMRQLAATRSPIAINAQNVLALFRGETTQRLAEPIVVTPNSNRFGNTETPTHPSPLTTQYSLTAYPNPFNENTVIEATLPEKSIGEVIITDVAGRILKKIPLKTTANKIELNGEVFGGYGIFFYSLYLDGKLVKTNTITRTH